MSLVWTCDFCLEVTECVIYADEDGCCDVVLCAECEQDMSEAAAAGKTS